MKKIQEEILIGAHTSTAGGLKNALLEGQEIGATTIQFFTSNQKQWKGRILTPEIIEEWNQAKEKTGIKKLMSHDSYLINLGCPNPENLGKSRQAFREEVIRCLALGVTFLNFHPGAALDGSVQQCLDCIVESLLEIEPLLEGHSLRLLLENTAGQGSAVGYRFEHLKYILDQVGKKIPLGVCIDTCHAFVAGYDMRTQETFNATLQEFDRVVSLENLYAFHLNDSVKGLGTRVDRHAALGKGLIGWDCFNLLMTDPRTALLPKYLETPEGPSRWKEEIQTLRSFTEA